MKKVLLRFDTYSLPKTGRWSRELLTVLFSSGYENKHPGLLQA